MKVVNCPCGSAANEYRDCAGFYNYECTKCGFSLYKDFEHYMTGRAAWNRHVAAAIKSGATEASDEH